GWRGEVSRSCSQEPRGMSRIRPVVRNLRSRSRWARRLHASLAIMSVPVAIGTAHPVRLELDDAVLSGDLSVPPDAAGLIIFAHGSGSSRHSQRNRAVAGVLQHARLATLLLDLLTEREELVDAATAQHRFDIEMLADRVVGALEWAHGHPATAPLAAGLFGA